jgi:periplasmic divalent cation tolerance protein
MPDGEILSMSHLIILTTMPDRESAQRLAEGLIEHSIAACVNILPEMQSIYRWNGERQQGSEHQLIIKTCSDQYENVEKWIQNKHPYELPEILAIPIQYGLGEYLEWINENCGNAE